MDERGTNWTGIIFAVFGFVSILNILNESRGRRIFDAESARTGLRHTVLKVIPMTRSLKTVIGAARFVYVQQAIATELGNDFLQLNPCQLSKVIREASKNLVWTDQ